MLEDACRFVVSPVRPSSAPCFTSWGRIISLSTGLEKVYFHIDPLTLRLLSVSQKIQPPSVTIYIHPCWLSSDSVIADLSLFRLLFPVNLLPLTTLFLFYLCVSLPLPLTLPCLLTLAPSVHECNSICSQSARGFGVLLITDFTAVEPCRGARDLQHLPMSCLSWAEHKQAEENIYTVGEMTVGVRERIWEIKGRIWGDEKLLLQMEKKKQKERKGGR